MFIDIIKRPLRVSPAALTCRTAGREFREDLEGFRYTAGSSKVVRVPIGLAGGVDGFRRLLSQIVEIALLAGQSLRRRVVQPHGQSNAGRRAEHFTLDVRGVPELTAQQFLDFAEGDAGLGDRDLQLRVPVILKGLGGPHGLRGLLQRLELVEKACRDDFSRQTILRQGRRDREGVDDQTMFVAGLPRHPADDEQRTHNNKSDQGRHRITDPIRVALASGRCDRQPVLFVEMLDLQADQHPLVFEVCTGLAGELGVEFRLLHRYRGRNSVGARDGAFRLVVLSFTADYLRYNAALCHIALPSQEPRGVRNSQAGPLALASFSSSVASGSAKDSATATYQAS